MTDAEILRQKLNLQDSLLDEKGKEQFLPRQMTFMMYSVLEMNRHMSIHRGSP